MWGDAQYEKYEMYEKYEILQERLEKDSAIRIRKRECILL